MRLSSSPKVLCGILLALSVSSAQADIIFTPGTTGTVENVLFNLQPNDQTGNPIFGNINNTADTTVVFGGTEDLISPSGGQARIEAADGGLNFLDVALATAGTGFDSAVFNLNSVNGLTGLATIVAFDQFGTDHTFTLPLGNGENFFSLATPNSQFITDVQISTNIGLTDVRQIRLGDVQAVPGPVVGAGLPGLLIACGALVALARRRRASAPG